MSDQGPNLGVERLRAEFSIEENKLNEKRLRLRQAELDDERSRIDESIQALLVSRKELEKQLSAMPKDS
jgi:hypothetical protein